MEQARPPINPHAWTAMESALSVIGSRSAMVLIREAFRGARRFDDFSRGAGLTPQVTARRLKDFVAAGLMVKEPYKDAGQRTRDEYALTTTGAALFPVLLTLIAYGRQLEGGDELLEFDHGGQCGTPLHAEMRCTAGHDVDILGPDANAKIRFVTRGDH